MAWYGLCGNQQAGTNVFAQVNILIRSQQRYGGFVAATNCNEAVHKVLPAFLQVHTPFAQ